MFYAEWPRYDFVEVGFVCRPKRGVSRPKQMWRIGQDNVRVRGEACFGCDHKTCPLVRSHRWARCRAFPFARRIQGRDERLNRAKIISPCPSDGETRSFWGKLNLSFAKIFSYDKIFHRIFIRCGRFGMPWVKITTQQIAINQRETTMFCGKTRQIAGMRKGNHGDFS